MSEDDLELEKSLAAQFAYWEKIEDETDRGATLIVHALFEEWLREKIEDQFVECDGAKMRADMGRTLYSFADKVCIGFALGLIDKNAWDGLKKINKIRNRFAHEKDHLQFEDEPIKAWCAELDVVHSGRPANTPRDRYISYVLQVLDDIRIDIASGAPEQRRRGEIVSAASAHWRLPRRKPLP